MIDCRGRNGWFIFSEFDAYTYPRSKVSSVSIHSKKLGNFPPIHLEGPSDEMIKLFENILSELKK